MLVARRLARARPRSFATLALSEAPVLDIPAFRNPVVQPPPRVAPPSVTAPPGTVAAPVEHEKPRSALRARRPRVQALTLTDGAVDRIKTLLQRRPDAVGIKLGVRSRGCNGLSYVMDFVAAGDPTKAADEVIDDARGVKVVVDSKALIHLIGTTMDYKDTDLAAEFVFSNPNAKSSCGCGESFNV